MLKRERGRWLQRALQRAVFLRVARAASARKAFATQRGALAGLRAPAIDGARDVNAAWSFSERCAGMQKAGPLYNRHLR